MRALLLVALLGCGGALAAGRGGPVPLTGVVNLNTATPEQLDLLPGVGRKAAEAILAHRQKRPFRRVEELVRVKGFGRKRFLRLKGFLRVEGETTLAPAPKGGRKEVAPPSPDRG